MNEEHKNISRHAGTFGFFTFLSRIMGLIRDSILAFALGAGPVADAFYVAFRLPNLLRRLVAEGSLTIAFVPVFTSYLNESEEKGREVLSVVFTYLLIFLVALTGLGVLFAPFLVKLIASGFAKEPEKFIMAVNLARIMFPYILLISLVALAMGVLNSKHRFATPSASPILLNLFIIIGAFIGIKFFSQPVWSIAIFVLLGGLAQLLLQVPSLYAVKMIPTFNFKWSHPAIKEILFLMGPSAYGAAIYQVNVVVITLLASFLPDGSVSYLWFADRLAEFPLGIFAIAIASASLPSLSRLIAKGDEDGFKNTISFGLKMTWVITIPASIGLFALARPIVEMLFMRGRFTPEDAEMTAMAVRMFAIGIPFVGAVRNIIPAFYARRDAKTPVIISTIILIVNFLLAFALMQSLRHVGLAMAMAISSMINFVLLKIILVRKYGKIPPLFFDFIRTLICALPIYFFIYFIAIKYPFPSGVVYQLLWILTVIASSMFLYSAGLIVFYKDGFRFLRSLIRI